MSALMLNCKLILKIKVIVLELPIGDEEKFVNDPYQRDEGNCGLYTTMLGTERFTYLSHNVILIKII